MRYVFLLFLGFFAALLLVLTRHTISDMGGRKFDLRDGPTLGMTSALGFMFFLLIWGLGFLWITWDLGY